MDCIFARGFVLIVFFCSSISAQEPPFGAKAKPTRLLSNDAGEGPAWHPQRGLFFSGPRGITRISPSGTLQPFRYPSGGSNGLLFDLDGHLVICEARRRRVTRTDDQGRTTVLADQYQGKRFNTPNDLTIDSKGRVYFSDPRYGDRKDMEILDDNNNPIEGVYRIDRPGQVTRIITHEVDRPNGLLITPDDKYLFVADNNNNQVGGARQLFRFNLTSNGDIVPGSRKLIFNWQDGRGPDGMALDRQGRLYVAGGRNKTNQYESANQFKAGVYVMTQEGQQIGFVAIPRDEVTNCTFGGRDLKSLFITAGGQLWRIPTLTAGWSPIRTPTHK